MKINTTQIEHEMSHLNEMVAALEIEAATCSAELDLYCQKNHQVAQLLGGASKEREICKSETEQAKELLKKAYQTKSFCRLVKDCFGPELPNKWSNLWSDFKDYVMGFNGKLHQKACEMFRSAEKHQTNADQQYAAANNLAQSTNS